jgi:hypothetical protein
LLPDEDINQSFDFNKFSSTPGVKIHNNLILLDLSKDNWMNNLQSGLILIRMRTDRYMSTINMESLNINKYRIAFMTPLIKYNIFKSNMSEKDRMTLIIDDKQLNINLKNLIIFFIITF